MFVFASGFFFRHLMVLLSGVILPDVMTDTPAQWEQRLDLLKLALQVLRKFVNRWLSPGALFSLFFCLSRTHFFALMF